MFGVHNGVMGTLLPFAYVFYFPTRGIKLPSAEHQKIAESESEHNFFHNCSAASLPTLMQNSNSSSSSKPTHSSSGGNVLTEELNSSAASSVTVAVPLDFNRLPGPGLSFYDIRDEGRIFVDKTNFVEYMLDRKAKFYFMARPKNFGKTIFVEMLASFFKGEKERFKNLTIANRGNGERFGEWVQYPVVHIDFSTLKLESIFTVKHFDKKLTGRLLTIAKDGYGLKYRENEFLLLTMVEHLRKKFNNRPVVILIDEYDEPLRQAWRKGDQLASDIRDYLDSFYKEIRGCRSHLKLVFVTGVSKLTLNTLEVGPIFVDLSDENEVAAAMGFEKEAIVNNFEPYLSELDGKSKELLERLQKWLNSYRFATERPPAKINQNFNPHSVIECLRNRKFKPYQTQTGFLDDVPPIKLNDQNMKWNHKLQYDPPNDTFELYFHDDEIQKALRRKGVKLDRDTQINLVKQNSENSSSHKLRDAFAREDMDEVQELLDAEFLGHISSQRNYTEEKLTVHFMNHLRLHNVPCEGFVKLVTKKGEDKGDIDTQTTDLQLNYVIEIKCTREIQLASGATSKSFDSDVEIIKKFIKYANFPDLFHGVTKKSVNSRKEIMLLGLTIHRSEDVVKNEKKEDRKIRYKIGSWLLMPYKYESKNEANLKRNINIAELRASDPKLRHKVQPLFD